MSSSPPPTMSSIAKRPPPNVNSPSPPDARSNLAGIVLPAIGCVLQIGFCSDSGFGPILLEKKTHLAPRRRKHGELSSHKSGERRAERIRHSHRQRRRRRHPAMSPRCIRTVPLAILGASLARYGHDDGHATSSPYIHDRMGCSQRARQRRRNDRRRSRLFLGRPPPRNGRAPAVARTRHYPALAGSRGKTFARRRVYAHLARYHGTAPARHALLRKKRIHAYRENHRFLRHAPHRVRQVLSAPLVFLPLSSRARRGARDLLSD